jgi:hypothetical protein
MHGNKVIIIIIKSRACDMQRREVYTNFSWENFRARNQYENLRIA